MPLLPRRKFQLAPKDGFPLPNEVELPMSSTIEKGLYPARYVEFLMAEISNALCAQRAARLDMLGCKTKSG